MTADGRLQHIFLMRMQVCTLLCGLESTRRTSSSFKCEGGTRFLLLVIKCATSTPVGMRGVKNEKQRVRDRRIGMCMFARATTQPKP